MSETSFPTTNDKFELKPLSLTGCPPPASVAEALKPLGLDLVIRLTEPPIASASISGVRVLFTSIDWIIAEGIKSSCTFLLSPSADGTLSPFKVTEFCPGPRPLITIFLASPWSPCMLTPAILLITSPTLSSGNFPIWSAETTFVTLISDFCLFNPLMIPLWKPETTTSANSLTAVSKVKSKVEVAPESTVTDSSTVSKPM